MSISMYHVAPTGTGAAPLARTISDSELESGRGCNDAMAWQ